jgi:hypothetical protein
VAGRRRIGRELMLPLPEVWANELADLAAELNVPRTHLIREAIYAQYGDRLSDVHYGRVKTGELPIPHGKKIRVRAAIEET